MAIVGKLLRGHFEVDRTLGSGGVGETYLGKDIDRPGHPKCVVKRLKPSTDAAHLPVIRTLFTREAETLEKLGHHDQIPRLLAYFEENEEFFLVQEFIEGRPLNEELLSGHHWVETKVIQLLQDVLTVLEFVHSQDVIHRDIKPANLIRRAADSKVILIDFGAVKQVRQDPQASPQTRIGNLTTISIGTEGYMPLEQQNFQPHKSSDIYALGMIGIQALTGVEPAQLQRGADAEVIWQPEAQVSEELASILTRMVLYDFRNRYQSATEVLQDLRTLTLHSSTKQSPTITEPTSPHPNNETKISLYDSNPSNSPHPRPETKAGISRKQSVLFIGLGIAVIGAAVATAVSFVSKPNYSKLETALQQKDWEAADEETYQIMLKIAGPISESRGYFDKAEWNEFPCNELRKIDQLWSRVSEQRLGFSAQRRVLDEVDENAAKYYAAIGWKPLGKSYLVQWKYNKETKQAEYSPGRKPNFEDPPEGHLPAKLKWDDAADHRFSRIKSCNL